MTAPSPTTGLGPDAADMNAAVSAADVYFSGVGNQQMAALDLDGGGVSGTQYVVNQNQQQAYQPHLAGGAATGELLLL